MSDIFLPKQLPDSNPLFRWLNQILRWSKRNTLQSSSDVLITQTDGGTTLELVKRRPITATSSPAVNVMWTVFNESSSYSQGDQVLVDCNKPYSIPFDATSGSLPPLCAGLFQCLISVPASGSRPSGNVYYPISPTIPTSSVVTVSGSIYNQTFWQPLAPMIKMNVCVNGSTMTAFINGVVSGSTFDLSQLPYH